MIDSKKIIQLAHKPLFQAVLVIGLTIILTFLDKLMPQDDYLQVNAGPWIVSTAMVLLFIIINTLVALRINTIIPYWIQSIFVFLGLLAFSYGWSFLLSGKHIDEVGSFRWLWIVLGFVYVIFFGIVRSMKRIVDFAINQDNKLRGED